VRLLRNLALFFVLFLPLSCTTAWVGGALEGPMEATRAAYPIQVFLTGAMRLLLPTFLAVPVLHFALRNRTRLVAVLVTPFALLAVHIAFFGLAYVGPPLLAIFAVAGGVYGLVFAPSGSAKSTARAGTGA
jgi:hypothetical protein